MARPEPTHADDLTVEHVGMRLGAEIFWLNKVFADLDELDQQG